jgi:hypothetical protein
MNRTASAVICECSVPPQPKASVGSRRRKVNWTMRDMIYFSTVTGGRWRGTMLRKSPRL